MWVVVAIAIGFVVLVVLGIVLSLGRAGELERQEELERARRQAWTIHDHHDAA